MTYEIDKPSKPTYYVFYGDVARHVGVCMPSEVTTTGQPHSIVNTDPAAWLLASAQIDMPDLPELPNEGEQVAINVYQYNGERIICQTQHTRTSDEPSNEPQHFTIST